MPKRKISGRIKKWPQRAIALLLFLSLFLAGCSADIEEESVLPQTSGTDPVETTSATAPALPTLPENPGAADEDRCALTSKNQMAETEDGYYLLISYDLLFYASKSDLTQWYFVCPDPNCDHQNCATRQTEHIWYRDGQLYIGKLNSSDYPDICGTYVCTIEPDGSGKTLVFSVPEEHTAGSHFFTPCGNAEGYVDAGYVMNQSGNWDVFVRYVDDQGARTLFSCEIEPQSDLMPLVEDNNLSLKVQGDIVLGSVWLPLDDSGGEIADFYQLYNDTIRAIPLGESCDLYGAFVSGDSCYHFHPGDGYYYLDIATGQEVKYLDCADPDGIGYCLDGKWILETTISSATRTSQSQTPAISLYDGSQWISATLPQELGTATGFSLVSATSELVFFTVQAEDASYGNVVLYALRMDTGEVEKCVETSQLRESYGLS